MAGKSIPCTWYHCLKENCSHAEGGKGPIKQVGTATGSLFCHMQGCQPVLCQQIRARSKNSPVIMP